jgi:tetratricopeptide (TPR) repeat protein
MAQLDRVVVLSEQGDAEQAQSLLDALLREHPDSVPALKVQGMLLEQSGRAQQASLVYRKALQLAPQDSALLFQVGLVSLSAGDADQAIDLLLRGMKVAPGNAQALYYLALAYHAKHNEALAIETIRKCLALEPDNPLVGQKYGEFLANSGDNAAAEQWLLKAQKADPNLKRIDFDIAVASFRNSDLPTADRFATRAAESQPTDLDALRVLAKTKESLSLPQDAKAIFERIVTAQPDDVSSLLGLGQCDLELKDYQAAVDALELVLQLDPAQVNAHFFLSRALSGLGRPVEAKHEAELHSAMLRQNSFIPPKDQLQREQAILDHVVQLLLDNREDEAMRLVEAEDQGNAASPGRGDTILASIYLSMHRFDDARRLLQHALKLDPRSPDAHAYLGELALLQDDLKNAEEGFQAELSLFPHHTLAMAELGEVRYRQQQWAEAAELLSDSRTTTPRLLYLLCDSYFHLGKVASGNLAAETVAAYAKDAPAVMRDLVDLLNRNGQSELAQRLAQNLKR